jgi:long-chain acyl-CoA synthetase
VVLIGKNRRGLFVTLAEGHDLGAVAVPLVHDASATERAFRINACVAKAAFAENQEQVDKVLSILPRCPTVVAIIYGHLYKLPHPLHCGMV